MSGPPLFDMFRGYSGVRAIALAGTCLIFIGHYFLPDKTLPLPINEYTATLYGYADRERGKSAQWTGEQGRSWTCDFRAADTYGCGWSVNTATAPGKGLDFRGFTSLEVVLRYRGPATRIRVYMRNHNPAYASAEVPASSKPMEATFAVDEAHSPVRVHLSDFRVAGWWLGERKSRRQWQKTEFHNIIAVGVDFPERGFHEIDIQHLALTGRWISTENLLIGIISFWMAVFLGEGAARFYGLYRTAQRDRQAIRELEDKQRRLTEENVHLANLANTDPLTGIYNRTGMHRRLEAMALRDKGLAGVGVIAMDLDHFKALNDRYGHDLGDKVLKTFAALLAMNLRNDDIFARIGGEEFVVVCRRQPVEGVHAFADKLRQLAGQCTFNSEDGLGITVSIGVAIMAEGEAFADALKRADDALYRAKQSGRNRVEFDSLS